MAYNKQRLKEKMLNELDLVPIISTVCIRIGITRHTYYRWTVEDPTFKQLAETSLIKGREFINELAESKLIQMIDQGEKWAIQYWLSHNKPRYKKLFRENIASDNESGVTKVKAVVVTAREEIQRLEELESRR